MFAGLAYWTLEGFDRLQDPWVRGSLIGMIIFTFFNGLLFGLTGNFVLTYLGRALKQLFSHSETFRLIEQSYVSPWDREELNPGPPAKVTTRPRRGEKGSASL